ncbi:histidine kinase, partial [Paenibacillus sepulcri]|nr:histidine kinase [Paenibacillus sepulcri]
MLRGLQRVLTRPFLNIRFRNKLFAVFALVAVAPLLFFAFYSYGTMKAELTRQTYASMAVTTDQISANLRTKLDAYAKVSSSLYLDPRLRDILIQTYSSESSLIDAYSYINSTFKNILTTNNEIMSMTIYTHNETIPADNVFLRKADEKMRRSPWYEPVSKSYGSVTFTVMTATNPPDDQVVKGIEERKPARVVLARLLDNNSLNYPYGYLTMEIPEADIYALIEKEYKNKELFIVSEEGAIVSARDKTLLNQPLAGLVQGNWSAEPDGSFMGHYKGERVYVVYNSIGSGWRTVSIVSYDSLIKNVKLAFSRLFTLAVFIVGLAILLIYLTARLITKRIETLLQLTRRIEREDFSMPDTFMGHDEVGQLAFAMLKMSRRLKEMITVVYKKEIAKKEAEMSMLQAQINPHFLYNTLASISALAMLSEDARIHKMVTNLGKFYRISLNKGKTIISFGEELKLTQAYVAIQQLRFEGMLNIHYDIDESVSPYPVVKLALQPFIENSINHAIWDDEAPLNIIIRARTQGGTLVLE